MQINEQRVRSLGARLRTVGEDAESYVRSMTGPLEQGCQGNDGFVAVATLRQTLERLGHLTNNLAMESQRTGDRVVQCAVNHATTDAAHSRGFGSLTQQLSGRG
ncbi:hypothetical protein ACFQ3B_05980 [Stackebrandtia endophytica]|uniref:hypothetical protein n=1 Tax=Stackebrandtia endophytica TaxID=1496996 RepID=UPI00114D68C0|nr:hypothetical protein [Stackebrandtia endophytica]